jgi:choloylglycine hydrolase
MHREPPCRLIRPTVALCVLGLAVGLAVGPARACSTFELMKGGELLYGHNLNQPGMDVPGLVFINKRGVFKIGRSWSEMSTPERSDPSTLSWISRYGSVTFSTFGRDMPDGGFNEAGLYIWEMNDETEYPRNDTLPKLVQMNWMQYVLDNFATLDEAVASASAIEIGGWGWHYFVSDHQGRCASIEFIHGAVVVHRGEAMPVPGLFNEPYARELEVAREFKGFGGFYEPDLDDRKVPRFVKTAVMIRDYEPSRDAVEYGRMMLDRLQVNESPKWSVLVDARRKVVHFKTARNPSWKHFSLAWCDYSNATPVLVLDMDQKQGGDVARRFHPATDGEIGEFLSALPVPDAFFKRLGIEKAEFVARFATHHRLAESPARQGFRGTWRTAPTEGTAADGADRYTLELSVSGAAVAGAIVDGRGDRYPLDHVSLVGRELALSFRDGTGAFLMGRAVLSGDRMDLRLRGIEESVGDYVLERVRAPAP